MMGILVFVLPTNLNPQTIESSEKTGISRTYRSFVLGMSPNEVKDNLRLDNWFNYQGDPDLSLLQRPRASLIDTEGSLFISRCLFQFEENSLIAIVLELDSQIVDWYSVYSALENKYGTPSNLNPNKIVWEDNQTRLTMEKPLTVKYLDRIVFNAALEEDSNRKAWLAQARDEFLGEF
ncbi:hypothetical protein [Olavius algarvensis spirochete endosymbiont]|uniref:hypothetical protein n=1 Tax=Olavius algarvensis spirochete endosymbiont TaxID=260710 RepID=UPI0003653E42|nr:hypothetical protein [Olavius algarvensis spirochete endosymbiont]